MMKEKLNFYSDYDEPVGLPSEETFSEITSYTLHSPQKKP